MNLYIGSTAHINYQGDSVEIKQVTNYPWEGKIRFEIKTENHSRQVLSLEYQDGVNSIR